jgi:predicted secreted protein with PEFG-CTERM motif
MNSRGYTVTSIAIAFMAVTLLSVPGFGGNAYAAGAGMSLSADANYMSGQINVSGDTDRTYDPVIIKVTNSNGVHAVGQADASDGSYSWSGGVEGMEGSYTISAQQGVGAGKYNLSVTITESDSSASSTSIATTSGTSVAETTSAPAGGLTITASDSVRGSTTIDVSGTTDRDGVITLIVTAPNGNVVSVDQLTPSGGSYSATIGTGGNQYSQDGMYTISAKQGDASMYNVSTEVEIVDGHVIPEFGTIAAMILVVAIVAIIAVSAKTKLSLVQKY